MNVKMLVAAVVSGLLAVSLANAAPLQMADDMNAGTNMPGDNNANGVMQSPSTDLSNPGAAAPMNTSSADSSNPSVSNDDMSADTATGDDDY